MKTIHRLAFAVAALLFVASATPARAEMRDYCSDVYSACARNCTNDLCLMSCYDQHMNCECDLHPGNC